MVISAPTQKVRKQIDYLNWFSLGFISVLAVAALAGTFVLRQHADERKQVIRELEQLSVAALGQSNLMWQALGDVPGLDRQALSMQEQIGRRAAYEHLGQLVQLEERGESLNRVLGIASSQSVLENLEGSTSRFLSNVQSVFGLMNITDVRMLRDRFRFGDRYYEYLQEAIGAVSVAATSAAATADRAAQSVTVMAVLSTLLLAFWGSLRLGRLRARREIDLLNERAETLRASEARFRALVNNSSDLISVLEPNQRVRYASPASGLMLGHSAETLVGRHFWTLFGSDVPLPQGEVRLELASGIKYLEVQVNDLQNHSDVRGWVINARDISERKELEDKLRYQALHDALTGLPNRRQLDLMLAERLAEDQDFVVMFVDLDGFKLVNDSYGHRSGDHVLLEAARRLESCLTEADCIARQGGDEFIAVLSGSEWNVAEQAAQRFLAQFAVPFKVAEQEIFLNASIGVATSVTGESAEVLVQKADIAMYHAKKSGKGRYSFYSEDMASLAADRLHLQSDFKRALERGEFQVYYQPKVNLESQRIESMEALVRWQHPDKGIISPGLFIPFAEETGLIEQLGKFILDTACQDAASWADKSVVMAVNLSPVQFRNPALVDEVREAIHSSGMNPALLELEITESAVLGDARRTIEVLTELKALGVRLAIDDFGTGYSNLSHLKDYQVDVLKIDQSFIRGGHPASQDLSDKVIVEAVIAMSKAFGLHVVAEGVETSDQAAQLRDMGCDLGQGYYFAKPMPKAAMDELMKQL